MVNKSTKQLHTPVANYLRNVSTWAAAVAPQRRGFIHAMRNRMYGPQETRDAWGWYCDGWIDGQRDMD